MLDQITHLFRLQAIIEAGSMRRAAEVLCITQPALTRSIAQLEARFGQRLLDRHSRGVVPTAFGLQVLRSTRRMARHWAVIEEELMSGRRGAGTTLRVIAGPMWRAVVVPAVLGQLQQQFPDLIVELRNSFGQSGRQQLLDGGVDVVFGGLQDPQVPTDRLTTREFTVVHDRVVARETHPLFDTVRAGQRIDPQRLLDYPWLIYDADPAYRETTLHATVERLGRAPRIGFVCESLISAIRILQNSDALCILPHAAVVDTVSPRILPLPVAISRRAVSSGAIYRAEMADWPPLAALLDLCAGWFQGAAVAGVVPKEPDQP